MAWTVPRTWVAAELVSAAMMNTHLRDQLTLLKTCITDLGVVQGSGENLTNLPAANLLIASQAQGDLLHASSPTVWTRLGKNATATRYLSNTGASNNPAWAQVDLATGVTGTLPDGSVPDPLPAVSAQNLTSVPAEDLLIAFQAQGDLLYASSTTAWSRLAKNATATRYLSNTGTTNNPAWAQVNLADGAFGVIPNASVPNPLPSVSGENLSNLPANRLLIASQDQGDLLYATSISAWGRLPKNVTATRYLSNTGASNNPAWAQVALATGVSGILPDASFPSTLPAKNGSLLTNLTAANLSGTIPNASVPNPLPSVSAANLTSVPAQNLLIFSQAQGDLLYASSASAWSRLGKNATATRYLSNTGTTNNPAWAQVNLTDGVTGQLPDGNIAGLTASKLTGALPAISGASLTSLNAAVLSGALPAISGAALTALPNPLPATSGANLTNLDAADLATGSVPGARLANAWPVGSIFISAVSTNPGTLLGFGSWSAFGTGRVLVGIDAGQTEFDTLLETGGAKTHTLTLAQSPSHSHAMGLHNHTVTINDPGHYHSIPFVTATGGSYYGMYGGWAGPRTIHPTDVIWTNYGATTPAATPAYTSITASENLVNPGPTDSKGGDTAHNNLQPYIVVYMWKRDS